MQFSEIKETDILIVGAGPVGLLAANFFGKLNHNCTIIDKLEKPISIPRAISIDDETLRIIQAVGLLEDFLKISKSVKGLQLCNQQGKLLFTFTKEATSGFDASHLFYSPELENLLRTKLQEYPSVKFFENTEFLQIEENENKVIVQLLYQTKHQLKIQTKYLIGCDGAKSKVAKLMNFKLTDLNYTAKNLKIDVALQKKISYSDWIKKYCSASDKAFVFLDSWNTHKRIEFSLQKHQSENLNDYQDKIAKILGSTSYKILHSTVYSFHSKIAQVWRKNKIAIAGDAAHLMPPYIGQGMCAGFRDVHNISWKLHYILKYQFPETILETYQSERYPHTKFVIRLTMLTGWLYRTPLHIFLQLARYFIPQKFMVFHAPPIQLKKGLFIKKGSSGYLFPQFKVMSFEGKIKNSDEFLGNEFSLVFYAKNSNFNFEPEDKLTLSILGIKTLQINSENTINAQKIQILDSTGNFGKWFKKNKVTAVLVRPDRYIFGVYSELQVRKMILDIRKTINM